MGNKLLLSIVLLFIIDGTAYSQGNWELLFPSHASNHLVGMYFIDDQTGWSVGEYGTILKTTDGGESWEQLDNRYVNNLSRILFRDENNGWIIGEKGIILHTSDGGATWTLQPSNKNISLNGIDLIGADGIIIVGDQSTILVSHDDGQNWQPVKGDSTVSSYYSFDDVYFLDELHGWIGGGYAMYTTLMKTQSMAGKPGQESDNQGVISEIFMS